MRSVIVYYSYSGNTKKVAEVLKQQLEKEGQADIIHLEAEDESESFFGQAWRAFFKKRAKIKEVLFDLSGYDLICLGTPVWAFEPTPAVQAYLDSCAGLEGKKVVIFTTYGSGAGKDRCMNAMESALRKKGAEQFGRFSISQMKVNDANHIIGEIERCRKGLSGA